MNRRKQTHLSFIGFAVALLGCSGCAVNQQSRFQNAFLPPPARGEEPLRVGLEDLPVVQPNVYLADIHPTLTGAPQVPPRKTKGDAMVQRAEREFEAGK